MINPSKKRIRLQRKKKQNNDKQEKEKVIESVPPRFDAIDEATEEVNVQEGYKSPPRPIVPKKHRKPIGVKNKPKKKKEKATKEIGFAREEDDSPFLPKRKKKGSLKNQKHQ